jgi:hypothetical protein
MAGHVQHACTGWHVDGSCRADRRNAASADDDRASIRSGSARTIDQAYANQRNHRLGNRDVTKHILMECFRPLC